MHLMKAVIILAILLAPSVLIHAGAEEKVVVEIAEGASKVDNGKFFVPAQITIPVGTTVVWKNLDDAPHAVTSGTADSAWGTVFRSKVLRLNDVYEFTFDKAGTFPYLSPLYPWMAGKIIVGEGQDVPIELSVKAERTSYSVGDNVVIRGSVSSPLANTPVLVEVLNPNKESVASESLSVDSDGAFTYSFKLAGKSIIPGSYMIRVIYSDTSAESMFTVEKGEVSGDGGSADVRVAAKQIKDLLLVRVSNSQSSDASVYSITIGISDSVMEAFRGPKNWNNDNVTPTEATSSAEENPLSPGDRTYFKVKVSDGDFVIRWTAYDSNNNVIDEGEAKPIRR